PLPKRAYRLGRDQASRCYKVRQLLHSLIQCVGELTRELQRHRLRAPRDLQPTATRVDPHSRPAPPAHEASTPGTATHAPTGLRVQQSVRQVVKSRQRLTLRGVAVTLRDAEGVAGLHVSLDAGNQLIRVLCSGVSAHL